MSGKDKSHSVSLSFPKGSNCSVFSDFYSSASSVFVSPRGHDAFSVISDTFFLTLGRSLNGTFLVTPVYLHRGAPSSPHSYVLGNIPLCAIVHSSDAADIVLRIISCCVLCDAGLRQHDAGFIRGHCSHCSQSLERNKRRQHIAGSAVRLMCWNCHHGKLKSHSLSYHHWLAILLPFSHWVALLLPYYHWVSLLLPYYHWFALQLP